MITFNDLADLLAQEGQSLQHRTVTHEAIAQAMHSLSLRIRLLIAQREEENARLEKTLADILDE